ncbi:hypothetical protein [Tumebacillus flagellatus]|uniref:Carboxymuconolactone decarboxylase-like domain-containing protein n=1 Tax=Tumebacillus flagellatus TaxID=1157490 RepID=A0A074LNW6_9BACL|nr:hypothetical protein [Tumebacillus flagellatus]KEO83861.1 hypothetical protein EL26_08060 [Tumebacillus flagellatus]
MQQANDYRASDLPDWHKAALQLVDLMAANDLSGRDEVYAILQAHLSDSEVVEITMCIGFFLGTGRVNRFLDVEF